jgi:phosphate transport system substrate-binding protein
MRKISLFLSGVMLVALLAVMMPMSSGLAQDNSTPTPAPIDPVVAQITADYPATDGATSTIPLETMVVCVLYDIPCDWVDGWETNSIAAEEGDGADLLTSLILHNTTHDAYMNLIDGLADLNLVATLPSDDELAAADEAGVELEAEAIALDGLVFIVNIDNPIESLTLDQIRDIYTGEITSWEDLGVDYDGPIAAYRRNRNSGSQELMDNLVLGDTPMLDLPDMEIPTMGGTMNAVANDPYGISYTVYYYAIYMVPNENVRLVPIEGVEPTAATIGKRLYPLTSEVYAVVRADTPADSTAILLRDWMLSDDGQSAIAKSGYIPVLEP